MPFPVDLPVVEHPAELFDRTGKELPFLLRQSGGRKGQKLFPIGIAGKQIGVPPHVAGFDSFALGIGEARQRVLRNPKDRFGDPIPPEG